MKILMGILAGLIVIVAVGFLIIATSLGGIVKNGVNRLGPEMTKSKVELGSAKISPFNGHGSLLDLTVGNPSGWSSDHAFSLKEITVDIRPGSLISDHVIVDNVLIDHPDIVYETKITSSNLQDLMNNIQQSGGASPTSGKEKKPTKIEIKNFVLQNGKITAKAGDRSVSFDLPTISLQNLGTNDGGLTPAQLSFAILKEVTRRAIQTAANGTFGQSLLDKAGAKAGESLRKLFGSDRNGSKSPTPVASP